MPSDIIPPAARAAMHDLGARLPAPTSPPGLLLGLAFLAALLYLAYLAALPRPLPGIPHNAAAARHPLGDLPELVAQMRTRDFRGWFGQLAARLGSPIVQVLPPGGRLLSLLLLTSPRRRGPTVVLSDFAAAQDLLLRRSREFDRPAGVLAALRGVIPNHHIAMRTSDPQFRRNRELVRDLMTPGFLHTVNAPEIWRNTLQFVDLWRLKARLAGGRPFDGAEDVARMTFDIIKNVAIGRGEDTMIERYLDQIRAELGDGSTRRGGEQRAEDDKDEPFPFPKAPQDETMEAQHRMNEALTPALPLPPRLYHAINNLRPYMREAYASKERLLRKQVALAVKRMEAGEPLESALDYMIQREIGAAQKEQRAPVFDSPYMFDELYGYLGAGHDTTATTFQWGMKHLARHPSAQARAREDLRRAHADARAQGRAPSAAEIIRTPVPYLEAVIEEILRLSGPVGATAREATVDTTILGRRVPKGTTVFLSIQGPGLTGPSVRDSQHAARTAKGGVEEREEEGGDKTQSSSSSHTKRLDWDAMEPEAFLPERWLVEDEEGKMAYDAQAGPMLGFSLGIRGCFGRRLAYLTLRMLFTMLIWNFELEAVPDELDSWKAVQILTRKPVQCYVRLSEVE